MKTKLSLMLSQIVAAHQRFVAKLIAFPLLLFCVVGAYVIASIVWVGGWGFLVFATHFESWVNKHDVAAGLLFLALVGFLAAAWLHLLYLTFATLVGSVHIVGNRALVARIAQTIFLVVSLFAVTYYYLQLFSNNKAFNGLGLIDSHSDEQVTSIPDVFDKLVRPPKADSVVNCFYFSVITIATVGYGDIYPLSSTAKSIVCVEVLMGYILLVISISSALNTTSK